MRKAPQPWRMSAVFMVTAAFAPSQAGAQSISYVCEIVRSIVSTAKTSSTRRLNLRIELDTESAKLRFDDESRFGSTQIDVLNDDRIQGSNGPLHFTLDRRTGRLVRSLGGGGRSLLDTGFCTVEKKGP